MAKFVEYFMTPVSPYTYLGHDRLRDICRRHGARIDLKLMDLAKVFPVSGGVPLKDRAPQRKAYRLLELRRWRDRLGIALTLEPKHFPVPSGPAAALILSVLDLLGTDAALDVAGDCLRAIWSEDRDISSEATLGEIVTARGLDARGLLEHAHGDKVARRYADDTEEAIARGVFGAPSYFFDNELFWGQDRLDFVERALAA
jgi:2-hydroxychromene-2-carboxylate isomerase